MANEKFKGVPIFLNGTTYYVPSLSLGQFQDNFELLNKSAEPAAEVDLKAQFDEYLPLLLLAFQRNYPELTLEDLRGWLDLNTFVEALLAVRGASGMKVVAPGE